MIKKLSLYLASALLSCGFIACNESTDYENVELIYSNVSVKSFSLKADSKVLNNLDSVFFSIDLVNARIFNADSLPYGTKIDRLLVDIATDACSTVELHVPRVNNTDTVINYLEHSTDSIDFANGPVKLHLVSFDKKAERDYTISVNVHQAIPDSLYWNHLAGRTLPSALSRILAQKTVRYNNQAFCLTTDGSQYSIATTDNPGDDNWTVSETALTFTPDINTFTAADDALYILASDGTLYTSPDAISWTSCGVNWLNINGAYGKTVLGIRRSEGRTYHVTYPQTTEIPVAQDFPITGNSQFFRYTSEWNDAPQVITVGGRTSGGIVTGGTWAYDGKTWAKIGDTPFQAEGVTMFPYLCCETDTNTWVTTERSVFVALGGRRPDNSMQRNVYISYNLGFSWKLADIKMQLPDEVPATYGSQALVFNTTMHARSASCWTDYMLRPIPDGWAIIPGRMSRAVSPITEWDTPYIYIFGGSLQDGSLNDGIWRGVLNRLTFIPLQ